MPWQRMDSRLRGNDGVRNQLLQATSPRSTQRSRYLENA
jgi:hypothetical protein